MLFAALTMLFAALTMLFAALTSYDMRTDTTRSVKKGQILGFQNVETAEYDELEPPCT